MSRQTHEKVEQAIARAREIVPEADMALARAALVAEYTVGLRAHLAELAEHIKHGKLPAPPAKPHSNSALVDTLAGCIVEGLGAEVAAEAGALDKSDPFLAVLVALSVTPPEFDELCDAIKGLLARQAALEAKLKTDEIPPQDLEAGWSLGWILTLFLVGVTLGTFAVALVLLEAL